MSLIKRRPRKTATRIKAEQYIYSHSAFFPNSVTTEDIERAIAKVEKALTELTLKPIKRTSKEA